MSWQPCFRCQEAVGSAICLSAQCLWSLACRYPAAALLAELAEDQCSLKWWMQLVGSALRVSDLPQGSLHRELLTDNVQDALAKPSSAKWAAQVVKHAVGPASAFCS